MVKPRYLQYPVSDRVGQVQSSAGESCSESGIENPGSVHASGVIVTGEELA